MKLYFSPGACSLSPHITLHESGLPFTAVKAPTKTHRLDDGTDYYTINPLGYVPLLELDDGTRLREGPAILQYVADQVPDRKLAPPAGTMARYRLQEWLTFIGTEIHKTYSPLFNPAMPEEAKAIFRDKIVARFKWVDEQLANSAYLMGDDFCVADGYMFVVSGWAPRVGVDLSALAHLQAWRERMSARPAVKAALEAEKQAAAA